MMNRKNIILLGVGIAFIFLAVWQIAAAQKGLEVINLHTSNPPVTIITPAEAAPASRPTILIAHGFAGSAILMRGFALTLAHAGYSTVSWDFEGHGANPNPLVSSNESEVLLKDAESALASAAQTGLIDTQHVAILGHSMGSGVALSYGSVHPDTFATIAISPVSQTVTTELPQNLLLMAGSLEPQFASNAQELLGMAGGQNADFSTGAARQMVIIPGVEHISILFSPIAHATARTWLDETFGVQPGATVYTDRRVIWFGFGILGFIFLSIAIVNTLPSTSPEKVSAAPRWMRLFALIGGCIAASLVLFLVSLTGVNLSQVLGLLVGGYIIIWFGIAGVISLLILRPHIYRPRSMEIIKGMVAFAALWLGVGLLGHFVWLPWLLIPARLWLWIPASIVLLPWFYTVGEASKEANGIGRIGWWLYQVVAVVAGFYLAITINPELGFIFLLLPLIPVMLGLHMMAISSKHGNWAFALPGAMFLSWLLLAVFPLR
jgi:pimeloyl-ACP methyl ester carboxylesterase